MPTQCLNLSLYWITTLTFLFLACKKDPDPQIEQETWEQVTGLLSPMGMAKDTKGRIWITEGGTGNNDARLSFVTLDGQKVVSLSGLPSVIANGAVEGISRPYIKGELLLFAHGISGKVYKLKKNLTSLADNQLTFTLSDFDVLDLNAFARALPTSIDSNTNVMDLHVDDKGDLYILDAGANVLIKSEKATNNFSVFAEFPKIPNEAPFPVSQDPVPTGLSFDGSKFLVSALSGVPFAPGKAKIFTVSTSGQVTEYKSNFTTLIDIELDANSQPTVLSYATFSLESGFAPNSGTISDSNGNILLNGLNQPSAILRKEGNVYYVLSYGDGTLKKYTL